MKEHQALTKQKICTSCSANFICGNTTHESCWCNQYPPIFELDNTTDCLCKECLHKATKLKIDEYVNNIAIQGVKNNIASELKATTSLILDIDYYIENELWVFTAWHHLKRGTCCGSNCRHCPYKPL